LLKTSKKDYKKIFQNLYKKDYKKVFKKDLQKDYKKIFKKDSKKKLGNKNFLQNLRKRFQNNLKK